MNSFRQYQWQKITLATCFFISILLSGFISSKIATNAAEPATVDQLTQQINQRKQEIQNLQQQITAYQNKITTKQKEATTVKNQLAILENQVAKLQLDIQATQIKIQENNLEIQRLNLNITDKQKAIQLQQDRVGEYLRLLRSNDHTSSFEVLFLHSSLADFFNYLASIEEINNGLTEALDNLKTNKQILEVQKNTAQEKQAEAVRLADQLASNKADLQEKSKGKQIVLAQATATQKQYQNQLKQLQAEQQQTNAEITNLEKTIRQKLEQQTNQKFNNLGPTHFVWPVGPSRGISTYFHDAEYPFRYVYEHPGLDIRTPQGTPIKSAEAGYVGKVKFAGDTSYAYIMVLHSNNLSTVYGHVSAVNVKEGQYVEKGQIIGRSGAMPGSVGAGAMTTGPHLHFEIRLNSVPVNPLGYLPAQ